MPVSRLSLFLFGGFEDFLQVVVGVERSDALVDPNVCPPSTRNEVTEPLM